MVARSKIAFPRQRVLRPPLQAKPLFQIPCLGSLPFSSCYFEGIVLERSEKADSCDTEPDCGLESHTGQMGTSGSTRALALKHSLQLPFPL
jgi:hypothetical protein